jgi:histidinol-phosphate/aromatic aminotransferase/cobyric acid decarboxylase-like protein
VLRRAPRSTRFWIDETYIDYTGDAESLEAFASESRNVIVCKSMSKVYALSGVRAACAALAALDYYRARWAETHVLRAELQQQLERFGWDVIPGCANFLLCHLPIDGPDTAQVVEQARLRGVFLRDVSTMGTRIDDRTLRVAVKDGAANARIVQALAAVLGECARACDLPAAAAC